MAATSRGDLAATAGAAAAFLGATARRGDLAATARYRGDIAATTSADCGPWCIGDLAATTSCRGDLAAAISCRGDLAGAQSSEDYGMAGLGER